MANPTDMYPFSPVILQMLHEAGWTEDRRIDVSRYERHAREVGVALFPVVREFVIRFGNLEFVRTRRVPVEGVLGSNVPPGVWRDERTTWFTTVADNFDAWEYSAYACDGGQISLQTIGEDAERQEFIAMDIQGRVYAGGHWGWINLVGINGADGIGACLTRRPPIATLWDEVTREAEPHVTEAADAARRMWGDYIERTGIVPPDEVVTLLVPQVQETIRQPAELATTRREQGPTR